MAADFDAEAFDAAEQAAADALDVAIDDAIAGDRTDPALAWLSDAFAAAPSQAITDRVARRIEQAEPTPRRRPAPAVSHDAWRWPRIVAAVLGLVLMSQGVGSLVSGEWIARNLGEPFAQHAATEGGFALLAVGFVTLIASLDRQWVVLALAAAVPLGITLGVHGIREVNVFAWGAVLHITEGVLALALLVTFVIAWRRTRRRG